MRSKAGSVTTTPLPTPNLTLVQGNAKTYIQTCDSARLSAAPLAMSNRPQESIHNVQQRTYSGFYSLSSLANHHAPSSLLCLSRTEQTPLKPQHCRLISEQYC